MAKGNKNTHISYIIEFNAIIPIKKVDKFNQIVTLKKNLHCNTIFFMMKRYKFIHIDKLQKCSCYLTSLLSYWDRMLLVHTFQFFNEKNSTVHGFKLCIYFQRMGIVFDFLYSKLHRD